MNNLSEYFRDVLTIEEPDKGMNSLRSESNLEGQHAGIAAHNFNVSHFLHNVDDLNKSESENEHLIRLLEGVKESICSESDADLVEKPSSCFIVEETDGPSSVRRNFAAPPPYALPPPSIKTPFNYATGVPHAKKPPPPSFAEAIATTTPLSAVGVELSPLAAHYIPPMPAAQQDQILLRNEHGVFLLQPIVKPTPPYTPPSLSSPISPSSRYVLSPAAPPSHFLGCSVAQAAGLIDGHAPKKPSASPYSAPRQLGGGGVAGAYTYISTSVKSKTAAHASPLPPPPPYCS